MDHGYKQKFVAFLRLSDISLSPAQCNIYLHFGYLHFCLAASHPNKVNSNCILTYRTFSACRKFQENNNLLHSNSGIMSPRCMTTLRQNLNIFPHTLINYPKTYFSISLVTDSCLQTYKRIIWIYITCVSAIMLKYFSLHSQRLFNNVRPVARSISLN